VPSTVNVIPLSVTIEALLLLPWATTVPNWSSSSTLTALSCGYNAGIVLPPPGFTAIVTVSPDRPKKVQLSTAPTADRSLATGVPSWSAPPPGTCVTVPFKIVPAICEPRT
jgi:hypothetical protein